jgi:hypothetical protein
MNDVNEGIKSIIKNAPTKSTLRIKWSGKSLNLKEFNAYYQKQLN